MERLTCCPHSLFIYHIKASSIVLSLQPKGCDPMCKISITMKIYLGFSSWVLPVVKYETKQQQQSSSTKQNGALFKGNNSGWWNDLLIKWVAIQSYQENNDTVGLCLTRYKAQRSLHMAFWFSPPSECSKTVSRNSKKILQYCPELN